jgi:hypothetical protein
VGLGVVGDVVGLGHGQAGADGGVNLSPQGKPDPADPQFANSPDAGDAGDRGGGLKTCVVVS